MSQLLQSIVQSPFFYFGAGILLIVLFFWYLSTELDSTKRRAGAFFIVGLASFCLLSLFINGMRYGIDIKGGEELTLRVQPKLDANGEPTIAPTEEDMAKACNILEQRLNASGTAEVQILHSGDKILIQIPLLDPNDAENNKKLMDEMVHKITQIANLELLEVHPTATVLLQDERTRNKIAAYTAALHRFQESGGKEKDPTKVGSYRTLPSDLQVTQSGKMTMDQTIVQNYQLAPQQLMHEALGEPITTEDGRYVYSFEILRTPTAAETKGVYISGAQVSAANPDASRPGYVNVSLNNEGADHMQKLTGAMNVGHDRLAVVLNGYVKCAPTVQSVLHKDFNISGLNGKNEPQNISQALANPLSSELVLEGRNSVTAQLGQSALRQGTIAGLIGMVGIFIFCYWYYRTAGIVAMVGLSFNALALLGLMSLFGFVLTLPGIAGIVLTMGMAVDANVLIYERLREEKAKGKPFIDCLRAAYEKAFSAIWDSNITSLITAIILFWLASGSIKGFAVTTSVGILTSLIGAIVVTRVLFFFAERFKLIKDIKFAKAPLEGKVIDFMKYRKVTAWGSIIAIAAMCAYGIFVRGDKALGVDFTGGANIEYAIPGTAQIDFNKVEETVAGMELSKAPTVQEFHGTDSRIIKIRVAEGDAEKVIEKLSADVPGMKELEKDAAVSSVSSALGASFLKTACWAILAGMLGITLYLAIRFEWSFAMGALVSTAHDVLAIIALVVLLGTELSIIHIGAFLTVAGYSINDTIVIYDRIRERLRSAEPNEKLIDIMNEAINSTLSRTLLTSGSTIAVLISLIFLGGPSMFDFSVAMLLGIFIGTYSSIYIASSVVLACDKKHNLRAELQARDEQDAKA
ncbi:MAG: protein translocase subunit SecD [Akkermansiaceae bacterium]|nr:protein translocase subunit SecD [Akkermansiaceae bacterium]